jgi:hypothetical protein
MQYLAAFRNPENDMYNNTAVIKLKQILIVLPSFFVLLLVNSWRDYFQLKEVIFDATILNRVESNDEV